MNARLERLSQRAVQSTNQQTKPQLVRDKLAALCQITLHRRLVPGQTLSVVPVGTPRPRLDAVR